MPLPAVLGTIGSIAGGVAGITGAARNIQEDFKGERPFEYLKKGPEVKSYMDEAFPGTTPWEQLGSSAAGSAISAHGPGTGARGQQRVQRSRGTTGRSVQNVQAATAMRVSELNAVAGIVREYMQNRPRGVEDALRLLGAVTGRRYPVPPRRPVSPHLPPEREFYDRFGMQEFEARSGARRRSAQTMNEQNRLALEGEKLEFEKFARENLSGRVASEMRGLWHLYDEDAERFLTGVGAGAAAIGVGGVLRQVGAAFGRRLTGAAASAWRRFQSRRTLRRSQEAVRNVSP